MEMWKEMTEAVFCLFVCCFQAILSPRSLFLEVIHPFIPIHFGVINSFMQFAEMGQQARQSDGCSSYRIVFSEPSSHIVPLDCIYWACKNFLPKLYSCFHCSL